MTLHRCACCDYPLDDPKTQLCLPCVIAQAKVAMGQAAVPTRTQASSGAVTSQVISHARTASSARASKKTQAKAKKKQKRKNKADPMGGGVPVRGRRTSASVSGRKPAGLSCVLCGMAVEPGQLLAHKWKFHAENPTPEPQRRRKARQPWVQVVSGGLPGLGKRC